jgi:hypothetical protein
MQRPPCGKRPPSPAKESAADHLAAIHAFANRLNRIEGAELAHVQPAAGADLWPHPDRWVPGHAILGLLAEAGASEKDRRKLASALRLIRDRARSYLEAIGDDRRASGQAVDPGPPPGDVNP